MTQSDRLHKTADGTAIDLAKHGITKIIIEHFLVGKYRYTNLDDAMAEVKRNETTRINKNT